MSLDEAVAIVYVDICVLYRQAAATCDPAQAEHGRLATLLEERYPYVIEKLRRDAIGGNREE
jgi:hypothetical protein